MHITTYPDRSRHSAIRSAVVCAITLSPLCKRFRPLKRRAKDMMRCHWLCGVAGRTRNERRPIPLTSLDVEVRQRSDRLRIAGVRRSPNDDGRPLTPARHCAADSAAHRSGPPLSRPTVRAAATHQGKVTPSRATIRPRFTTVRRPGRCATASATVSASTNTRSPPHPWASP